MEILKHLPDKCVDLVLTDPPYLITPHGGGRKGLSDRTSKIRDEIEFIANDFDFELITEQLLKVCKYTNIVMFCSSMQLGRTITYFENKGIRADVLVWSKTNPAPLGNNNYISDIEYIVFAHSRGSFFNNNVPIQWKRKTKLYPIITNKMSEKIHPTQKTYDLIIELLSTHSKEGDLILDCFSGSGTTAIACHNLNRRFICIEKDKEYYEASVKRLEKVQQQGLLF
jgi:site-specific DNA-methyltransferase (adenine-specific)